MQCKALARLAAINLSWRPIHELAGESDRVIHEIYRIAITDAVREHAREARIRLH